LNSKCPVQVCNPARKYYCPTGNPGIDDSQIMIGRKAMDSGNIPQIGAVPVHQGLPAESVSANSMRGQGGLSVQIDGHLQTCFEIHRPDWSGTHECIPVTSTNNGTILRHNLLLFLKCLKL